MAQVAKFELKHTASSIQASALPLSMSVLFFVGEEGGRTVDFAHIYHWQPTAVDLFPTLYRIQDAKLGGWKASKCQLRLG